MKFNLISFGFILLLTSACNFFSELKEDISKHSLDTYTMAPNNLFGEFYEIDYKNKTPQRFDIIEFNYEDETYIKRDFYSSDQHISRVIGLPNETVEIKNGYLFINDKFLNDKFISDSVRSNESMLKINLAADEYFLMIDNRKMIKNTAINDRTLKPYDSRCLGPIMQHRIVGITNLKKD